MKALHKMILKRRERLINKWKPELLSILRENAENTISLQYEKELDKLSEELYQVRKELKSILSNKDQYKHKYEEAKELNDKLLQKYEKSRTKIGELKTEVKHLDSELQQEK